MNVQSHHKPVNRANQCGPMCHKRSLNRQRAHAKPLSASEAAILIAAVVEKRLTDGQSVDLNSFRMSPAVAEEVYYELGADQVAQLTGCRPDLAAFQAMLSGN